MWAVYPWKSFKNLENLVKPMVLFGFLQNRSRKSGKANGFVSFMFKKLLKLAQAVFLATCGCKQLKIDGKTNGFGSAWVQVNQKHL